MKKDYDPSKMKSQANPHAEELLKQERAAIQETEYLLSIPGMRESIQEGMNAPEDEGTTKLDWSEDL